MITKMEQEGMKKGAFPMDKDEGIKSCREYRAALEAEGKKTWLEYFAGNIYIVRSK
jgi:hypothetical protein